MTKHTFDTQKILSRMSEIGAIKWGIIHITDVWLCELIQDVIDGKFNIDL